MKVHKITVYIHDHENYGPDEYRLVIDQHTHLPGHVSHDVETVDIGEWTDRSPLNLTCTAEKAHKALFDQGSGANDTGERCETKKYFVKYQEYQKHLGIGIEGANNGRPKWTILETEDIERAARDISSDNVNYAIQILSIALV